MSEKYGGHSALAPPEHLPVLGSVHQEARLGRLVGSPLWHCEFGFLTRVLCDFRIKVCLWFSAFVWFYSSWVWMAPVTCFKLIDYDRNDEMSLPWLSCHPAVRGARYGGALLKSQHSRRLQQGNHEFPALATFSLSEILSLSQKKETKKELELGCNDHVIESMWWPNLIPSTAKKEKEFILADWKEKFSLIARWSSSQVEEASVTGGLWLTDNTKPKPSVRQAQGSHFCQQHEWIWIWTLPHFRLQKKP